MFLKQGGYYVNRHSCFLLQYHLVLVTKYRHPVIRGQLETALRNYTKPILRIVILRFRHLNACRITFIFCLMQKI